jgi:hypothetical protein
MHGTIAALAQYRMDSFQFQAKPDKAKESRSRKFPLFFAATSVLAKGWPLLRVTGSGSGSNP